MIKKENLPECPVATTVSLIGSKWKLLILTDLGESMRPVISVMEQWGKEYKESI